MQHIKVLLFAIGLIFQVSVTAQTAFEGTWKGDLALDASTTMTLEFASSVEADGNRVVRLSSPDNGALNNIGATSVEINAEKVVLEFSSLNGRFEGVLDNQTVTGEWQQAGTTFPLVVTKLAEQLVSDADLSLIVGDWSGVLATPRGDQPVAVRFEAPENGSLQGIGIGPDGNPGGPPMSEISLADSNIRFVMQGLIYEGRISSETEIEGSLTMRNGAVVPLIWSKN